MSYGHLTESERTVIFYLRMGHRSQAEIARTLGSHPCTVSREWGRNRNDLGQYLPDHAQRQETRRRHLEYCQSHLDQLNPLAILQRGYAVATLLPAETVIRDAALVSPGAAVRVRVARGRLDCEVTEVSSEQ